MSVSIGGTTGITFNDASVQNTAATGFGFKNRLINSAMVIDQRNAGASVTQTTGLVYPVDRFLTNGSVTSKFTAQRSTTAPTGFTNSLLITSLAATTLGSTDYYLLRQPIEGFNTADFAFGSASAQTITLSFWVLSSLTGTFGGSLFNAAVNRCYAFSYTISSANTWEQKSVTIAGDTTGTWATDNTVGLYVDWSMGAGSSRLGTAGSWGSTVLRGPTGQTNLVGTNGATFYITGVQLEKGSTATSFDYRPYSAELALCQRYYEKSYDIGTIAGASTITGACKYVSPRTVNPSDDIFSVCYLASKRSSPTVTIYSTTGASGNIRNISSATDVASGGVTSGENSYSVRWSMTDGNFYGWQWISSSEL